MVAPWWQRRTRNTEERKSPCLCIVGGTDIRYYKCFRSEGVNLLTISILITAILRTLLTRKGSSREQRAVSHGELDLDVHPVGRASLYEGRPEPVVDGGVVNVTHHVRPPVDALFETSEAFLYPLQEININI